MAASVKRHGLGGGRALPVLRPYQNHGSGKLCIRDGRVGEGTPADRAAGSQNAGSKCWTKIARLVPTRTVGELYSRVRVGRAYLPPTDLTAEPNAFSKPVHPCGANVCPGDLVRGAMRPAGIIGRADDQGENSMVTLTGWKMGETRAC